MRGPVVGQGPAPAEAAATVGAVVGLLAGVDNLVLREVLALGETFAALVANVGTLPRVCPPVTDQQGGVGKAAPAVWARVRLLQILGTLVALQGQTIGEGATAVGTDGAPRRLPGEQSGLAGPPPSLALSGCLLRWEYFLVSILLSGSGFYRNTGRN